MSNAYSKLSLTGPRHEATSSVFHDPVGAFKSLASWTLSQTRCLRSTGSWGWSSREVTRLQRPCRAVAHALAIPFPFPCPFPFPPFLVLPLPTPNLEHALYMQHAKWSLQVNCKLSNLEGSFPPSQFPDETLAAVS